MSDKKPETEQKKEESPQAEAITPEQKEETPKPEAKPEEKKEITNSEIIGKKIFFLNPSVNIQNQIMNELSQHEYEVYSVRNSAHLTRVLRKYPDSIVYINLDDTQKAEAEKWIDMIAAAVPTVMIGIFSSSTDEELKDKYVKKPKVKCGFINIRFDMSKTVLQIIKILDSMDVKGRRKYLRATTENEETATINMPHGGGNFVNGTIKDISVVGFSCTFENDPGLKKNTLCKDIQIRLHTTLVKAEAIVFGSRSEYGNNVYVLLFSQRTDPEVSVKVRKYIQQNLQHKMEVNYK
ncbi:PilZ domain-containing protein [Treponema sp. R6D11]